MLRTSRINLLALRVVLMLGIAGAFQFGPYASQNSTGSSISADEILKPGERWLLSGMKCKPTQSIDQIPSEAGQLSHVHVAYIADGNSFDPLMSSMLSLTRNLNSPGLCSIHILTSEKDMVSAEALAVCFKRNVSEFSATVPTVVLHKLMPDLIPKFNATWSRDKGMWKRSDLVAPENFARYYLNTYIPGVPRVLYLDVDTVVRGDVARLYQMHMETPLAAVVDGARPSFEHYHKVVKMPLRKTLPPSSTAAFNGGVLLIDLTRWTDEIVQALDEATANYAEFECCTQLPLNIVFHGDFDVLSWAWNVQGFGWEWFRLPSKCAKYGQIFHWNGPRKPWKKVSGGLKMLPHPNDKYWVAAPVCNATEI